MGDPLITSDDLAVYLNDPSIDTDRASLLIDYAQQACETVLNPLPAAAAGIVAGLAGDAYTGILSPRAAATAAAGGQVGGGSGGGVYLTRAAERALRRLSSSSGGAFTIDMLPDDYTVPGSTITAGDLDVYGGEMYSTAGFDQVP